jgi:RND family efflux transporter MFP subunit
VGQRGWLIASAVCIVFLTFWVVSCSHNTAKPPDPDIGAAFSVSVGPVISRSVPSTFVATGNLVASETAQVTLGVSGKVVAMPLTTGALVNAGTVIAEIDPSEYQLRLEQARASQAQALLSLQQAENRINTAAKPFDPLKQPSVLVVAANRQSAKDQSEDAGRDLQRYRDLYRSGDVSEAAVERALHQSLVSNSQLASAEAQYQTELATAKTAMQSVVAAKANYESATAAVVLAENSLAACKVRSPIAGYLLTRTLNLGDYANSGSNAGTVVRTRPILMDALVPEGQEGRIAMKQPVRIRVVSRGDRSFRGLIQYLNPEMDTASRSVLVRIAIDNPDRVLRPGMFGSAEISLTKMETAIFVPASSVIQDLANGTETVFVLNENHVQARVVRTVAAEGGERRVFTGLTASDQAVISSNRALTDGAMVTVHP